MSFQIPLHFEDLTRSAAGTWQLTPATPREATSDRLLELLSDDIHEVLSSNTPPNPHFNALFTLITRYQNLNTNAQRPALVDALISLTRTAAPTDPVHLKICLFHASGLAVSASNATPPCKYWEKTGGEALLEALHTLLSAAPSPPPFPPADLDQLSSQLVRTTLHVLEQPTTAKHRHIRPLLARCLISALTLDERQFLPASTALLHALCRHERIPTPLAEILYRLCTDAPQLEPFVVEFVREIARLPAERLVQDVSAAKSVSAFIAEFAERFPAVFTANLPLVLSMLDIDSYTVRNGLVHVISVLIRQNHKADDPLLDVLLQHASRDVNAFTRSKALQAWISLVETKFVPNRLFPILAHMAASRLDDRTAAVRKYAAQLLVALLNNNPFGPTLKLSHYSQKLEELRQQLSNGDDGVKENPPENNPEKEIQDDETVVEGGEGGDTDDETSVESPPVHSAEGVEETDVSMTEKDQLLNEEMEEEDPAILEEQKQTMLKMRFYEFAVKLIIAMEKGLETVYNMLRSKSITDVAEAVSLLVTAVQFELEATTGVAVRKMLPLTLARESNIREKAIDAYVRLLAPGGKNSVDEKEAAMVVATGLTTMCGEATIGELACLEELVNALADSREECRIIVPAVIAVLWDLHADRVPGASMEQRRSAGMLVAMIAAKKPESLQQRIDIVLRVSLEDATFSRWGCVALTNLPAGSDVNGELCARLQELCQTSDLSTVEQAINAIYTLSLEPEPLVSSMITSLAEKLYESEGKEVPVENICRFFIVIGHVAVKELVRIEKLVSQLRKHAMESTLTEENSENNEEEERAGAEAEHALELAEKELVSPNSLLGRYSDLVRKVAGEASAPPSLRASAVLCLAKMMSVQKKFCEKNLRLLFSILASECDAMVRVNAVVALGDLAFRFPNLVEPWSSHIYNSLRDGDMRVRKNTLMVLTHLILNDMIKVKGQIVGMAVCVLDDDERIADLARVFFHELSRKSANAIYNILPDTISCMSKMEELSKDGFKTVITLLMGLMDKEKHADGMVEKLCHRFRSSDSDRENRDLAYCISQLNVSAKGVQKLNESFKSYSVAILDDEVYGHMMQAISKGNKAGAAGTTAQIVEEVTQKVEAVRRVAGKGEQQDGDGEDGTKAVQNAGGGRRPSRGSRGGSHGMQTNDKEASITTENDVAEDAEMENREETSEVVTRRGGARGRGASRGGRGGRGGRGRGAATATRATRPTRRKAKVVEESSEESSPEVSAEDSESEDDDDNTENE